MNRREFLKIIGASSAPLVLSGCGLTRIDPMHVLIRSDVIDNLDQEKEIMSRAKLDWTEDGAIRVIYLRGSAYERGYQHGKLLRKEIQDNLGYLWDQALKKFHFEELFDEAYERQRPFIPQEYVDEMHGLAHGSKMPLRIIHGIHALPEIGEWGGKKKIKAVVKMMMNGELGTSCSNFCAMGHSTADGNFYTVRVLDWGLHRVSKLHKYPLISVNMPEHGLAYANIGWVGFLGAISGMNEKGITLGEMGYGDNPTETMSGKPMPFLLRDILAYASTLKDAHRMIKESLGTNSFVFLISDGKTKEAELYVKDRERFLAFKPGQELKDNKIDLPGIKDVVYGGHYSEKMTEQLNKYHGQVTPEIIMKEIIPAIVMPSNFQNVVYDPVHLNFWVSNAKSKTERAAEQPYTFFDLAKALENFKK